MGVGENEIESTEPLQISCSPTQLDLESSVLSFNDTTSDAKGGLHREIIAPNSDIIIYDLNTGLPAKQIIRGHGYQAIVSLGEPLYSGFDMVVDSCSAGDNKDTEVIIDNNEVVESLDGIARISSELTGGADEANKNFAFDFTGFTRKGSHQMRIACQVTIVPVRSNKDDNQDAIPTESSNKIASEMFARFDSDTSDSISIKELWFYHDNMTKEQATNTIMSVDTDFDYELNFDEFLKAFGFDYTAPVVSTQVDSTTARPNEDAHSISPIEIFDHFDTDNSGNITAEELWTNVPDEDKMTKNEAMMAVAMSDMDGDNVLDFDEFSTALKSWLTEPEKDEPNYDLVDVKKATQLFVGMDTDKSGKISAQELLASAPPEAKATMDIAILRVKAVDQDGDNEISFDEFLASMSF